MLASRTLCLRSAGEVERESNGLRLDEENNEEEHTASFKVTPHLRAATSYASPSAPLEAESSHSSSAPRAASEIRGNLADKETVAMLATAGPSASIDGAGSDGDKRASSVAALLKGLAR